VGGMAFRGMSMTVVTPPEAAAYERSERSERFVPAKGGGGGGKGRLQLFESREKRTAVPVANPSHSVLPGSFKWTCASTNCSLSPSSPRQFNLVSQPKGKDAHKGEATCRRHIPSLRLLRRLDERGEGNGQRI
jgi:hypothetical protein